MKALLRDMVNGEVIVSEQADHNTLRDRTCCLLVGSSESPNMQFLDKSHPTPTN